MQKFILLILILGLGFFLYLIKTGEVDSNDFNIHKFQSPVEFTLKKTEYGGSDVTSVIYLTVRDVEYQLYTFTGSSFEHIPKSQYYEKKYNIPLEAIDAVTGVWLGARYVFYVTSEGKDQDLVYKVYKTEYATDSTAQAEYQQIKTVKGLDANGKIDVLY